MPHAKGETEQPVAHATPLLRVGSFIRACEPEKAHLLKPSEGKNSVGNFRAIMNIDKETTASKKRESRAGTRKVTSLSAEQLERKRANDREAQRTIRQRTREHIEQLEYQVAELKTKGDHFDDVVRRNAVLEGELRRLRHQLTMTTSGQSYSSDHGEQRSIQCYRRAFGNANFLGNRANLQRAIWISNFTVPRNPCSASSFRNAVDPSTVQSNSPRTCLAALHLSTIYLHIRIPRCRICE